MTRFAAMIASLPLFASSIALAEQTKMPSSIRTEVQAVAPALERYAQDRVFGNVWKRPGLSPRDRSIVTMAALVARNHTIEMPFYLNLALDNGVKPQEISEIITHLAFYSGWGNAMSPCFAVAAVRARPPFFVRILGAFAGSKFNDVSLETDAARLWGRARG